MTNTEKPKGPEASEKSKQLVDAVKNEITKLLNEDVGAGKDVDVSALQKAALNVVGDSEARRECTVLWGKVKDIFKTDLAGLATAKTIRITPEMQQKAKEALKPDTTTVVNEKLTKVRSALSNLKKKIESERAAPVSDEAKALAQELIKAVTEAKTDATLASLPEITSISAHIDRFKGDALQLVEFFKKNDSELQKLGKEVDPDGEYPEATEEEQSSKVLNKLEGELDKLMQKKEVQGLFAAIEKKFGMEATFLQGITLMFLRKTLSQMFALSSIDSLQMIGDSWHRRMARDQAKAEGIKITRDLQKTWDKSYELWKQKAFQMKDQKQRLEPMPTFKEIIANKGNIPPRLSGVNATPEKAPEKPKVGGLEFDGTTPKKLEKGKPIIFEASSTEKITFSPEKDESHFFTIDGIGKKFQFAVDGNVPDQVTLENPTNNTNAKAVIVRGKFAGTNTEVSIDTLLKTASEKKDDKDLTQLNWVGGKLSLQKPEKK